MQTVLQQSQSFEGCLANKSLAERRVYMKGFDSFTAVRSPRISFMTTTAIETNQLIELLKAKSEEGFSLLYNRYSGALFGLICKIVGNKEAGEELLQDVFVKVWHNIDKYAPEKGTLFTWLLNVARNTCIDYLRSKQHKINKQTDPHKEYDNAAAGFVHYNAENTELRGIARRLDVKYRQIIDMVYFWGYSQEEVSKMLNMPLGTVKTRCRNGLQELRAIYEEQNN